MRVYGLDFSSDPKDGKPLTRATCRLSGKQLSVEALDELRTFQAFALFLASSGEWIAGIDIPFGQPRRLIVDLNWPPTWAEYVRLVANMTKRQFTKCIDNYRNAQPAGSKEHLRAVDRKARSLSPMKMYGVPVGKMFQQGAPFLLASPCRVLPFDGAEKPTTVLEAYPGLVARKFIGRRSYKNDDKAKQTTDMAEARRELIACIHGSRMGAGKGIFDWYGFNVAMPSVLIEECVGDPSGDNLDAVLAAIQAAWAQTQKEQNFGIPTNCDLLEGWIPDPETATVEPA
jgi:hypothetical protein